MCSYLLNREQTYTVGISQTALMPFKKNGDTAQEPADIKAACISLSPLAKALVCVIVIKDRDVGSYSRENDCVAMEKERS